MKRIGDNQRNTGEIVRSQDDEKERILLNPFSDKFDANLALRCGADAVRNTLSSNRDRIVFDNAEALNHIHGCEGILQAPFRRLVGARARAPDEMERTRKRERECETREKKLRAMCKNRGDKAGRPNIFRRNENSGRVKNVLQNMMEESVCKHGPLSILSKAMSGRMRVCVTLRERHKLRSHLRARLVAFDRHMNMVVREAEESFFDSSLPRRKLGLTVVRGEHVVTVALCHS